MFESCREFERYLLGKSEAPEIKKDVELLAFELVESAGIQPAVVIGFMEGILFKFPVPLLGKKASVRAWVNLIRLVRHYRTRIVNGITDDLINRVGREWRESLDL